MVHCLYQLGSELDPETLDPYLLCCQALSRNLYFCQLLIERTVSVGLLKSVIGLLNLETDAAQKTLRSPAEKFIQFTYLIKWCTLINGITASSVLQLLIHERENKIRILKTTHQHTYKLMH
jgi:hypothetical protein